MAKLFAGDTIRSSYAEHLTKEHHGSKWGTTGYKYSGIYVEELILRRPYLQTALDYGCGKGELSRNIDMVSWTNYDPGMPEWSKKPQGQYDLVTCTDVMEHVEEECVDAVIQELAAYTGKVLFVDIACYLTGKLFGEGPYKGQDLHITVREPEWWRAKFDQCGLTFLSSSTLVKVTRKGERERLQMIYERT